MRGARAHAHEAQRQARAADGARGARQDLPRVHRGRIPDVAHHVHRRGPRQEPRVPAGVSQVWHSGSREDGQAGAETRAGFLRVQAQAREAHGGHEGGARRGRRLKGRQR